ncbi:MAG: Spy/CpxP family protein refolding chaperone [candidate division Zixibacteria bacterium]|nr:Spy/CpxP family protein refolding chaperone [candidate division Zixibacteria bacterium]NIR63761.1 Spy/CpxP family protein refolding chaperone [candidate division Zixibacteria bacterium]NIS15012.1 Spy/CpxP family protein refolding chaperone [candidate division Zixibacteria bacterium]NIS45721.1 Spy/CpxP family protein refolding chaperone [candidate division Zixibacteria bacterium]NIT51269.1 Spy/CpxP family protein refolding chaperone [candidate division Zixibacteria bacterium]
MKRHILIFTVLALLVFGLSTAFAQPRQQRFADRDDFPEFTTEQREQMDELRAEHQKEMIPLRADLRVLQVELRELIRNDASQSEINSKLDEIGALKTRISKMRMENHLNMRNILTDEQKEFFKDHPRMMRFMHDGMRGKGDRGRGFHGECQGFGPGRFGDDDDDDGGWGMRRNWGDNCPGPCMNF